MTNEEIKKAWTKMSRQIKKQGLNYTCVMNARQQALGTATIAVDYIHDPEIRIAKAEANFRNVLADAKKDAREHLAFVRRPWTTEWYFGEYLQECIEKGRQSEVDRINVTKKYMDGTGSLDDLIQIYIDQRTTRHHDYVESERSAPSWKDQQARARARFEELIGSQPVQDLLAQIGGTAQLELVAEGDYFIAYARFHY